MSERLFCIQDTRQYVGNSVLWWCVGANGYTCHIDEAWIVGEKEARQIERNRETDKAWPVEAIERAMSLHVDGQRLHRLENIRRAAQESLPGAIAALGGTATSGIAAGPVRGTR